jgi:CRP/FNR family transcriptional regulator, cyclic AMP receptor protein
MDKTKDVLRLMENVVFLKKYTLFSQLNTDELRGLSAIAEEVDVKDGTCVVKEDDAGDAMFIVKHGELRIVKGSGGSAVNLAVIPKHGYFGEMVLFEEGQLRSASVFAKGECTLLILRRDDLFEAMAQHPAIAFEFIKMFGKRLRDANERLRETQQKLVECTKEKDA